MNFNKYSEDGNRFISEFAAALSTEDTKKAGRMLKAVLHSIRNHLTLTESLQLLAQLPMFLKGVYVDGWSPKKKKRIKHYRDLAEEIIQINHLTAEHDFASEEEIYAAISAVFAGLRNYISLGELEDIKAVLPKELKNIVNGVIMI